jgi:hypothetical protein
MALIITPENRSFLSNNKFEFVLRRIPNFTYLVQSVNLPTLTLGSSSVNTPFVALSIPGTQLSFGTLSLTFMVDEDMQSWYELYDWMWQLGNPESYDKRGRLSDEDDLINSVTSDASLFVKTNSNNPNIKVVFKDVYPVELGELPFNSTGSQEFLTSTVTFAYTYYKIEI